MLHPSHMEGNINGSKFVPATDAQRKRFVNGKKSCGDVIPVSTPEFAPTAANGIARKKGEHPFYSPSTTSTSLPLFR
jgi:hypothetical protein